MTFLALRGRKSSKTGGRSLIIRRGERCGGRKSSKIGGRSLIIRRGDESNLFRQPQSCSFSIAADTVWARKTIPACFVNHNLDFSSLRPTRSELGKTIPACFVSHNLDFSPLRPTRSGLGKTIPACFVSHNLVFSSLRPTLPGLRGSFQFVSSATILSF